MRDPGERNLGFGKDWYEVCAFFYGRFDDLPVLLCYSVYIKIFLMVGSSREAVLLGLVSVFAGMGLY